MPHLNEWLALVRDAGYDDTGRLMADKARLMGEVENRPKLGASGPSAETIVPAMQQPQSEIAVSTSDSEPGIAGPEN